MALGFVVEHLNHVGIVAQVCREIGVAEWLAAQSPASRQHVSVGTATVAMVPNGLGLSNRRLYLLPQFFEDKPVEHLLGTGVCAADLNDDCPGRTLDWPYAHDVTTLFAGLALRARRAFAVPFTRLHADTTSFSVSGAYPTAVAPATMAAGDPVSEQEAESAEPAVIPVTYGYSRDHRADLKQWMLALITSGEGVPHYVRPLDGTASDKEELPRVVMDLTRQLRASGEEPAGPYVADSGLYSEANESAFDGRAAGDGAGGARIWPAGPPASGCPPLAREWHVQAQQLQLEAAALDREAPRKAAFLVATNVLDPLVLPDLELIHAYKARSAVERGSASLKDPLFLASSVFVEKPTRIMALAFITVLCLLVYRRAELRVRHQLAATNATVPNQLKQPTARPTMRRLFQRFEGIDRHHMTAADGTRTTHVLRLTSLHRQVLRLLGPAYETCYLASG
jgi:transposase